MILYAGRRSYLAILIDEHGRHDWILGAVEKRLREELATLHVMLNEEKTARDVRWGGSWKRSDGTA
jgi:RNA-directed DNA polymerase